MKVFSEEGCWWWVGSMGVCCVVCAHGCGVCVCDWVVRCVLSWHPATRTPWHTKLQQERLWFTVPIWLYLRWSIDAMPSVRSRLVSGMNHHVRSMVPTPLTWMLPMVMLPIFLTSLLGVSHVSLPYVLIVLRSRVVAMLRRLQSN